MKYLTIALTKGRLAEKTLEIFEKLGISCEEINDKSSRKLVFTDEENKIKIRYHIQKISKDKGPKSIFCQIKTVKSECSF